MAPTHQTSDLHGFFTRLTIVSDPDGLLTEEEIQTEIKQKNRT
jgi:hypothetical protein